MKRALIAGALLVAGLPMAAAQEAGIQWATDWQKAVEEAKVRNVPIVIAVHGEP